MDVLVLGGSVFLGRAVVTEAKALGGHVTVFNRGVSGTPPPGVAVLSGDRTDPDALAQLAGRHFDLVVDTSGYVPADVVRSAAVLAPTCGHYAFVSTVNVFPGWPQAANYRAAGAHTGDPDATRADVPAGLDPGAAYGWLKAGCERAAVRAFGADRLSVLRAGCIVGPHDSRVGRLPWWIDRVARGGDVLVPGAPDDRVALLDARDLARFALCGAAGTFEVGGAPARDTRAQLMAACAEATGTDANLHYVGDAWPAAQDVQPWTEVPLWAPDAPGLFDSDPAAAIAAGMTWRPLAETVRDTWRWQCGVPGGWRPTRATPGLTPLRERELLRCWARR